MINNRDRLLKLNSFQRFAMWFNLSQFCSSVTFFFICYVSSRFLHWLRQLLFLYFYPSSLTTTRAENWTSFELSKSTLGLAWLLYYSGTSRLGHLHSGDKKFGTGKISHNLCISPLKGHLCSGERAIFFLVPKPRFSLYSGKTLAFITWPTTNRVDTSKSTLITISLKSI